MCLKMFISMVSEQNGIWGIESYVGESASVRVSIALLWVYWFDPHQKQISTINF